jgi:hypothetical protein
MEHWSVEKCVEAVRQFITTKSVTKSQPAFHKEYGHREGLSSWSIWKQVQQKQETVLVHNRHPPGQARAARKPKVINAVQVATVESTQQSNAAHIHAR